ncbi:MAG: GYD domain-containing protein [Deltaproteobacteria bacterium]|nr:GYD domain-containing protein [Deltaproteobacteria bacterium]
MATFLMFGKYSSDALKGISAARTKKGTGVVKKFGGEVISMYAMLGEYDLLIIAAFPTVEEAMQASVGLNKLTGISFTTLPAVTVDAFDKLMAKI